MQALKEEKQSRKFKRRPKLPTARASTGASKHLEGSIWAEDTVLGSGRGASRAAFERYQAQWRREFEEDLPPARAGSLIDSLVDIVAHRWAVDPEEGLEEWNALEVPMSERVLSLLLRRTTELCTPAGSVQRKMGAESVYLPFELWASIATHLNGRDASVSTYRGLVLGDDAALRQLIDVNNEIIASYRQKKLSGTETLTRQPLSLAFLVLLDLTGSDFCDEDARTLHLAVGPTLAALRLDRTKVTEFSVQCLARSVSSEQMNYHRLRYLSFKNTKVGDRAVKALVKFPSLAALDMRGSAMTGILKDSNFFRIEVNAVGGIHYHKAANKELEVFASNLSLSSAYRRLRTQLESPTPAGHSLSHVAALVHIRELKREGDYSMPSVKSEVADQGVFTTSLGHVYSTAKMSRAALLEDNEGLRGGRAAFEVGAGSLVMAKGNEDEEDAKRAPRRALAMQFSDSEEPVQGPISAIEDALPSKRKQVQTSVPEDGSPLLLFRKVWHAGEVPLAKETKPDLPTLNAAAPMPSSQRPSDEPCVARKSKQPVDFLQSFQLPRPAHASSSMTMPRPMSSVSSNGLSQPMPPKRPASAPAASFASRAKLSAFKKPKFTPT